MVARSSSTRSPNRTRWMRRGSSIRLRSAAPVSCRPGRPVASRNRARRVVRGRSPLSNAEFAGLFATQAEAALGPVIRNCLRAYVPLDPALVRPDDKLCEELQLAVFDGIDANEFLLEVERSTGVGIPDGDAQRMFTLRDIVSYVAARRHERAT